LVAAQTTEADHGPAGEVVAKEKVRAISGFPEWLPAEQIAENRLTGKIRATYERFGFSPIETPAVERAEVLTAKGGVQRQIYGLTRPAADGVDRSGQALALHFDLTVPTARYVVQHERDLQFPFRRYQHQKVWRGERAQRGRFREFAQFDIDVIGRGELDILHDAEVLVVTAEVLAAIGLDDARIHVSHRRILGALAEAAGIGEPDRFLAIVDRTARDGAAAVLDEVRDLHAPAWLADSLGALLSAEDLDGARRVLRATGAEDDGVDSLQRIVDAARGLGIPAEKLVVDVSIARGLDYYTGMVVETFVGGEEQWGSICSGGRYDNLASHFGSREFPGVGVSIGVTRLFDLMLKSGRLEPAASSPAAVLVTTMSRQSHLDTYLSLARRLRDAGHNTETYLQDRPLRDQLADAAAKGIPLVLIAGEQELDEGAVALKDMRSGVQTVVPAAELEQRVATALSQDGGAR
jgi:histidyl-tRNA synthetase